jgi:CRISPR-associated protein Cmr6
LKELRQELSDSSSAPEKDRPKIAHSFVELLENLHARRKAAMARLSPRISLTMESVSHVAIGSGNPSTIENSGLSFHHTYGFPILPGSSLKGLARHFLLEEYWEELCPHDTSIPEDAFPRNESCASVDRLLFGASDDPAAMGAVFIEDGWPLPPASGKTWFCNDVLTPHHPKYYSGEKKIADDTETPNIIHFLCLSQDTKFEIPIGLTPEGQKLDDALREIVLAFARHLLILALSTWGIGSRTGAGLGRLRECKPRKSGKGASSTNKKGHPV